METLDNKMLIEVHGGISKVLKYGIMGIIAGCVFLASIIYGYIHPEKC